MNEEWRDIKGYEGLYQVSNLGRVKSFKYNKVKILSPSKNNHGYLSVVLCKDGICKNAKVHRLVANACIPNLDDKPYVDHIDTDRTNNNVSNLRWVTAKENNDNELTNKKYKRKAKELYDLGKANKPIGTKGSDNPKSKKVVQLSLEGDFICVWDSIRGTEEEGFLFKHVCDCCRGKRKTHKGFKWMYLSDYEEMIK